MTGTSTASDVHPLPGVEHPATRHWGQAAPDTRNLLRHFRCLRHCIRSHLFLLNRTLSPVSVGEPVLVPSVVPPDSPGVG